MSDSMTWSYASRSVPTDLQLPQRQIPKARSPVARQRLNFREWQSHDLRLEKICIEDTTRQP